jgi:hypothetical protein
MPVNAVGGQFLLLTFTPCLHRLSALAGMPPKLIYLIESQRRQRYQQPERSYTADTLSGFAAVIDHSEPDSIPVVGGSLIPVLSHSLQGRHAALHQSNQVTRVSCAPPVTFDAAAQADVGYTENSLLRKFACLNCNSSLDLRQFRLLPAL